MTTFTPNAITSAPINERFEMKLTADGSTSGYSFVYFININGQTLTTERTTKLNYNFVLSESVINSLLTNVWNTKFVFGSWHAQVYKSGSSNIVITASANIGFIIPDYEHTIDVTITDINPVTLALTGDATKFIVTGSIPRVSVVVGHKNGYDRSAIHGLELSVDSVASSDGSVITEAADTTWSPVHGEESCTWSNDFSIKSTYRTDVWVSDSRGYSKRYSYVPSSWNGSTYYVPYMLSDKGFVREEQTASTAVLKCRPRAWLQNFGLQTNTLTLSIQVKEYGEDDTQYVTTDTYTISANPSSVTNYAITYTFLTNKSYVCRWVLTDKLHTVYGNECVLSTQYPIFAISESRMDVFGDLHVHDDLYVDSLFYKSGDTMTINQNLPIPGYVTSNTKTMRFNVTVGKSTKYVNSVAVTAMGGWIRGLNGYINGYTQYAVDFLAEPTLTVTARIVGEHSVILVVTSSATITNVDNNTPLVYAPDATLCLTLTFGGS